MRWRVCLGSSLKLIQLQFLRNCERALVGLSPVILPLFDFRLPVWILDTSGSGKRQVACEAVVF